MNKKNVPCICAWLVITFSMIAFCSFFYADISNKKFIESAKETVLSDDFDKQFKDRRNKLPDDFIAEYEYLNNVIDVYKYTPNSKDYTAASLINKTNEAYNSIVNYDFNYFNDDMLIGELPMFCYIMPFFNKTIISNEGYTMEITFRDSVVALLEINMILPINKINFLEEVSVKYDSYLNLKDIDYYRLKDVFNNNSDLTKNYSITFCFVDPNVFNVTTKVGTFIFDLSKQNIH